MNNITQHFEASINRFHVFALAHLQVRSAIGQRHQRGGTRASGGVPVDDVDSMLSVRSGVCHALS